MPTAVGIDLGGTKVAAGVVDAGGRVLQRAELPYDTSGFDGLRGLVAELMERLDPPELVGVGIGAAGVVDFERGRYLFGPNTGLRELDLSGTLSEDLGTRVLVDNDANCAAWGEHRYGAGRGTRHFLCVTLGTGIGGGLVIDGQPYRGAHGGAGEIGHMIVDPTGPLCGCGRRGCWEQLASGLALQRTAREELVLESGSVLYERTGGDPSRLTGPMVTEAAREGDGFALRAVDRMARWVGWGLGSLVNIFEPERVAIGGGLARDWDLFGAVTRRAMEEQAEAPEFRPLPEVVAAELGPNAGIVGAALLVFGAG